MVLGLLAPFLKTPGKRIRVEGMNRVDVNKCRSNGMVSVGESDVGDESPTDV